MVIYLADKYSGHTIDEVELNVYEAGRIAIELWDKGYTVICPHMNSAMFDYVCVNAAYHNFLFGYMDIMKRCDAVIMGPNWKLSKGAQIERFYASYCNLPVYEYPDLPMLSETHYNEKLFYEGMKDGINT